MIDVTCDHYVSRPDPPLPSQTRQTEKQIRSKDPGSVSEGTGLQLGRGWSLGGAWPGLSVTGGQKIEARPYGGGGGEARSGMGWSGPPPSLEPGACLYL